MQKNENLIDLICRRTIAGLNILMLMTIGALRPKKITVIRDREQTPRLYEDLVLYLLDKLPFPLLKRLFDFVNITRDWVRRLGV